MARDRNVIQYINGFARYDSSLFYTLQPGRFRFCNREFDIAFDVNEAGLRDDAASLDNPEIIVLGDSYAMGWGVEQDSTFAQRLEKKLNKKVLNAGVSSYGTAREIKLLNYLDTDNLKYLIIQHSPNDVWENEMYVKNNGLKISEQNLYVASCEKHDKGRRYFILKHLFIFKSIIRRVPRLIQNFEVRTGKPEHTNDQATTFLKILDCSLKVNATVRIIVFSSDIFGVPNNFIPELKAKLEEKEFSHFKSRIKAINLSTKLDENCYFTLDEHYNSRGHKIISNQLEKFLVD